MKRILLPTDFSENAYNAIKYAVQLLKNEECLFYLLNTYTPVLYDTEYILYAPSHLSLNEVYKNNSQVGLARVQEKITKAFPNPKHTFHHISSFSLLNEEIRAQVDEKKIDLIIMGTQGATGADEILFGTQTVHAIKRAKCPLLAIPSNFEYVNPDDVLFPTDYDIDYTQLQLTFLKWFIEMHASELHIMNVFFGKPLAPEQEKSKKVLATYFKENKHVFYSIENKSVPLAIYDFQTDKPIDLLVMINNKHSFFENLLFRPVINELGFHVKIPFLVIPPAK
ncbi:universal stress protein [Gillisia sp. M10.2A]|uniref:Universal stress protein n=1 Tax=Gillisia lutea TaxID=2909668 RepID=A0ABS9EIR4_9FLAO|nr:universal stress protein [Gillisia lutea]MCF4102716.1 universal stress protein [Gillisia lutea]